MKAWKELKRQKYPGGVRLTTKDLRDYFATEVSARVNDPNTVKNLMRHTSLNTTTLYTRTVTERMKDAVKDLGKPLEASLGGKSGSNSLRKKTQNSTLVKLAIKELIARRAKGNSGGGSETV
jgi:hypothetical protein